MLKFHHMGLITGEPDLARNYLSVLGYQAGDSVFDPEQNVTLCMCSSNEAPLIELVTPSESNKSLSRLLHRKGDYVYHICFTVPIISKGVEKLSESSQGKVVEVMPPKPAVLFNGANVAFYSVSGIGLVELLEQQ